MYRFSNRQLSIMFRPPATTGLPTPAQFQRMTTPLPARIFNEYTRPINRFKRYLRPRLKRPFKRYLDHHRRKNHKNRHNPWTVKTQNEPNFQISEISISPLFLKFNASSLKPFSQKNEPNRTQSAQAKHFRPKTLEIGDLFGRRNSLSAL